MIAQFPRIEADPEQGLWIDWPDGHQTHYSPARLRALCPCALCGGEGRGGDPGPKPGAPLRLAGSGPNPASVRLVRFETVGRYAIAPVWADGHSTGILPWELLRESCDCFACRAARAAARGGSGGSEEGASSAGGATAGRTAPGEGTEG